MQLIAGAINIERTGRAEFATRHRLHAPLEFEHRVQRRRARHPQGHLIGDIRFVELSDGQCFGLSYRRESDAGQAFRQDVRVHRNSSLS